MAADSSKCLRQSRTLGTSAGLDLDALASAFEQLQLQHDTQKESLESLTEQVEARKQGAADVQEQQRATQAELSDVRKRAQEARGRLSSLETLQHAALGQEQGAAMSWLKARGLDNASRVGEKLTVEPGAVAGVGLIRPGSRACREARRCGAGWRAMSPHGRTGSAGRTRTGSCARRRSCRRACAWTA